MLTFAILDNENIVINAIEAESLQVAQSLFENNEVVQLSQFESCWIGGSYTDNGFTPPLSEKPEGMLWDFNEKSWMPETPMPPEPAIGFWVWNNDTKEWQIPAYLNELNTEEELLQYGLDINKKRIFRSNGGTITNETITF
jgi:hypothetical protein